MVRVVPRHKGPAAHAPELQHGAEMSGHPEQHDDCEYASLRETNPYLRRATAEERKKMFQLTVDTSRAVEAEGRD